jgi:alkanesulfonate monooxygenase SsuD/methylene tetrahydromethanopterin reductase-like flavin-dependent oxidoreductase (luciferase family)
MATLQGCRGLSRLSAPGASMALCASPSIFPHFGDFADPRAVADLARRAEAAGWDGLFIWDHVTYEKRLVREIGDPRVLGPPIPRSLWLSS